MTDKQWNDLLKVVSGELLRPIPVGFIIDSPWLPGWAGITILDYYTSERLWLETNFRVVQRFPEVIFFPGFWSEFGMCTEPAAWGARCIWPEDEFPIAERVIHDYSEIDRLKKPNCRTDGLCPFVVKRLLHRQEMIEREGHAIRFAVSRGPMNIGSFLLGHSELLNGLRTHPRQIHKLLRMVTDFVVEWLQWQATLFPSIGGVMILDDIIGLVRDEEFEAFVLPYFTELGHALDVPVKILHNDCYGLLVAKHLTKMGFNVYNFSHEHSLVEVRTLAGPEVTLLGNIPPREVLAQGTPDDVRQAVRKALASMPDHRRWILSCGGGMPPNVPTQNVDAFYEAAVAATKSG
jgi:uroporphyrinogen-III decarboxylase